MTSKVDAAVNAQSQLLSRSAAGAKYLIVLQVGSRALTFAVNQLLLRYLSPELLGIATQLEVYSISILFFSREALRVAFQRQTDAADKTDVNNAADNKKIALTSNKSAAEKTQAVVNLAYVSIGLGIGFQYLLQWAYLRSLQANPSVLEAPHFGAALSIYGASALVELLSEPSFAVVQQKSEYKIRACAESVATVLRCAVTCGATILAARSVRDIGVLPFAFGQFAYSLSLVLVYVGNVWLLAGRSGFSIWPKTISSAQYILGYFSKPLLTLGASLFIQGILKHFLTQGDVLLIAYLSTLEDQGIYALASNYGGLVARMLFQPIEESSRNYFGKQLSSIDGQPSKDQVSTASNHLHLLLRFYALLSVSAAAVGPTVAPMLLGIVAGSRWTASGAGEVLGKYCYYIPLLAVNGVTEAFISAVASRSELNRQSIWMVAFSVGFALAGYLFLRVFEMGAEGLVWANVINMAVRIIWSFDFIGRYLGARGSHLSMSSILPQRATIAYGVGTAALLHQIKRGLTGGLIDFVKVGAVAGLYVVMLAILERQYFMQLYRTMTGNKGR